MNAMRRLHRWWVITPARRMLTPLLLDVLPGFTGVVLDIGGGRDAPHDRGWGANCRRLRIDIVERHMPDVGGDAHHLPIADGVVDGAVGIQLLEHIRHPEQVLAELERVLAPGGRVCLAVPFIYQVHGDPHDYYRYTADGLRVLLAAFEDVEVTPVGGVFAAAWTLIAGRSRLARSINPAMRWLVARTADDYAPTGYVAVGRKSVGNESAETS